MRLPGLHAGDVYIAIAFANIMNIKANYGVQNLSTTLLAYVHSPGSTESHIYKLIQGQYEGLHYTKSS